MLISDVEAISKSPKRFGKLYPVIFKWNPSILNLIKKSGYQGLHRKAINLHA